ncbi:MAG: VOC family protein [Ignavibacteriales bacterium]|nr:VOC family protein [Ignavibacteriales bacterium]
MQKITPFLWFDNNAEEAISFYTSVFKDSQIKFITRHGEGAPVPTGTVMTASILLNGQEFMLLNGGPMYKFTPAISFFVKCADQEEIDYFWEKLTEGGTEVQCGWLTDKFGLSWQIVPEKIGELLHPDTPDKLQRVMQALMQMVKIDMAVLQKAYDGE